MPYKDTNKQKEYMKAWYQANKDSVKDYSIKHKKERKENARVWYQEHKKERKDYKKAWNQAHKEEYKDYQKAWHVDNPDYSKTYYKVNTNALGKTKGSIRAKSKRILKQMNLHINGYQIHHCFGYENANKFIYISKSLHLKIHQYLRDNNISADSNHWMQIRDIVNDTDEFTYIKC